MIEISDSQIKNFQRCPRRWAYEKILDLSPQEGRDNLILGNAVHDGLEEYTKTRDKIKAITASRDSITKSDQGTPTDLAWQIAVVPAMVAGYIQHFFPAFDQEYDFVSAEQWFESTANPMVKFRGFKDLKVRSRKTGKICLFDYKTTGMSGGGDLGKQVDTNNQLARYAVAERRETGEWPETVGLIFLQKPHINDPTAAALKAQTSPNFYYMFKTQVTPRFAAFALDVEKSDVIYGHQMLHYKEAYKRDGKAAIDSVPANYNECVVYNTLCGFAKGCHAGCPAHTLLPTK